MTDQRQSLLNKIRALFLKTTANGCTEAEAMAALDKARAMMDAYEVTAEDLQLTREQAAVIKTAAASNDRHGIRAYLATAVAAFCDCKVWQKGTRAPNGNRYTYTIVFCGLPSDVELAEWLLDTLQAFVQAELTNHLLGDIGDPKWRRRKINGFVGGCTLRIRQRLRELIDKSRQAQVGNSTALVVVKDTAIAEAMKAAGIKVGRGSRSHRRSDAESYAAGQSAGDRASFGRPVGDRVGGYLS